ncbi:MAG TPA: hypothetical protein PKW35_16040 [Nannocystaceae bacterium]|nr:hypothetical protein [Nannocystaceae bacterium]
MADHGPLQGALQGGAAPGLRAVGARRTLLSPAQVERARAAGLVLLLDVNDTLIRTGPVALSHALDDTASLFDVRRAICDLAGVAGKVRVVLISGNTLEYLRRVEEPLGLAACEGVDLAFISENGLVGRMGPIGPSWRHLPSPEAQLVMDNVAAAVLAEWSDEVFFQGNEVRLTLKPVRGHLRPPSLGTVLSLLGLRATPQVWGHWQTPHVDVFAAPYYVDIDPRSIMVNGELHPAGGKEEACRRVLATVGEALALAFGDSASDDGTFRVVQQHSGLSFQALNSSDRWSPTDALLTDEPFGRGVAATLNQLLAEIGPSRLRRLRRARGGWTPSRIIEWARQTGRRARRGDHEGAAPPVLYPPNLVRDAIVTFLANPRVTYTNY